MDAIAACQPVSDKAAKKVWDEGGAVGSNKNEKWGPLLANNTSIDNGMSCVDECSLSERKFSAIFQRIRPACKGIWHKNLF